MKPRLAVCTILRRGNTVAFVLRENVTWMAGYYGLPGGKVEDNETYTNAAIRELAEEAGVVVRPENMRYVHTMHRYAEPNWVDVFFEASTWEGEPYNAEPHMHKALEWLDMDNLPDNVIPAFKAALEAISRGELYSEYGW